MKVKFTVYIDSYIVKIAKAQLVRGEASRICENALSAAIKAVNVDQEIEDLTKRIKVLSEIKQMPVKEMDLGEALAELATIFYQYRREICDREANLFWIGQRSLRYKALKSVPTAHILEQIEMLKGDDNEKTRPKKKA